MDIQSSHLESARALVSKANSNYEACLKASREASAKLDAAQVEMRATQGAFDILASSFASGMDLEDARASALPEAVRKAIGYVNPKPPAVSEEPKK